MSILLLLDHVFPPPLPPPTSGGDLFSTARDGDVTDHGGVLEAITTRTFVDGRLVVTVGALHHCPRDGHGTNQVVQGAERHFSETMRTSRVGDMCECGATIITGSAKHKTHGLPTG